MRVRCTNCEYEGKPIVKNQGSCLVLLVLMFFFIIPGIIYLVWMASGRVVSCPRCGWKHCVILKK